MIVGEYGLEEGGWYLKEVRERYGAGFGSQTKRDGRLSKIKLAFRLA